MQLLHVLSHHTEVQLLHRSLPVVLEHTEVDRREEIFMCGEERELCDIVETRLSKKKKKAWREICTQNHWAYMSSTPTRSSSSGLLITNATKAVCGTPSFKGPPQIIICEDSVGVHVIKSFHTHRLIVLWIAIEDSRVNCWGGGGLLPGSSEHCLMTESNKPVYAHWLCIQYIFYGQIFTRGLIIVAHSILHIHMLGIRCMTVWLVKK